MVYPMWSCGNTHQSDCVLVFNGVGCSTRYQYIFQKNHLVFILKVFSLLIHLFILLSCQLVLSQPRLSELNKEGDHTRFKIFLTISYLKLRQKQHNK